MLLADVRVFLEIAGTGSFTGAAAALRLPKSSVARQLARLEEALGRTLLARTTRRVALTEDGRAFLPYARRLIDDSIEAMHVLRGDGEGASGLLSVSAPGTFGRQFLAPLLPGFRRRYPAVRVALRLSGARARLGVGEADVALRLGAVLEPDLGVRRLGQIEFWLVAAPSYLRGRPEPREPLDLSGHELIELPTPAADNRLELVRDGEHRSVRCVPAIGIDDPEAIRAVVLAGGGIATLPAFLAWADVAAGALRRVLPDWAPPPAPISLLHTARMAPPLRVRAFVDFMAEALGRAQPWRVPGRDSASAPGQAPDAGGPAGKTAHART